MYALCVSGTVNTRGFVWKFLCAVDGFSFIHFTFAVHCVVPRTVIQILTLWCCSDLCFELVEKSILNT